MDQDADVIGEPAQGLKPKQLHQSGNFVLVRVHADERDAVGHHHGDLDGDVRDAQCGEVRLFHDAVFGKRAVEFRRIAGVVREGHNHLGSAFDHGDVLGRDVPWIRDYRRPAARHLEAGVLELPFGGGRLIKRMGVVDILDRAGLGNELVAGQGPHDGADQ